MFIINNNNKKKSPTLSCVPSPCSCLWFDFAQRKLGFFLRTYFLSSVQKSESLQTDEGQCVNTSPLT